MAITPMIHGKIAVKSTSAGTGKRGTDSTTYTTGSAIIVSFVDENGTDVTDPPNSLGIDFSCWSNTITSTSKSGESMTTFFTKLDDPQHKIGIHRYVYTGTIEINAPLTLDVLDLVITVELFPKTANAFVTSNYGHCDDPTPGTDGRITVSVIGGTGAGEFTIHELEVAKNESTQTLDLHNVHAPNT